MNRFLLILSRKRKVFQFSALLVAITFAAYLDYRILFSTDVAVGLDGYYYVLQIDSLFTDQLYFEKRTPFVLYYLAGIRILVGNTIIAIKLGAILLNIILCLGVFGLLWRVTSSWWTSFLGSTYSAFAGLHLLMIGEFVSNHGAVALIVLGLFCLASFVSGGKRIWLGLTLLCFLLAIASHRSGILIVSALTILGIWAYFFHVAVAEKRKQLLTILFLLAMVLYFSPYVALVQTFFEVPEALMKDLSSSPRFPVTEFTLFDVLIIIVTAPTVLVHAIFSNKSTQSKFDILFYAVALSSVLLNLNVFFNPDFLAIGAAGRLQILIYLQISLLLPFALWKINQIGKKYMWYGLAFSLPLLILATQIDLPLGLQPHYLADRKKLIEALPSLTEHMPRNSLIVAPHGDQFVITAVSGIPAQNALPRDSKFDEVYIMLRFIPKRYVGSPAKEVITNSNGTATILLRESELKIFLERMDFNEREVLKYNNLQIKGYPT